MPEPKVISDADRKKVAAGLHALADLEQDLDKAEKVGHPGIDEYKARCSHCKARLKAYMDQFPRHQR